MVSFDAKIDTLIKYSLEDDSVHLHYKTKAYVFLEMVVGSTDLD